MFNRDNILTFCLLLIPIALLLLTVSILDQRVIERIATVLCINLILVLGLQVFMGNSGILSFAHIGFMGIGAYTSAVLAIPKAMKTMALPDIYPIFATIEIAPLPAILIGTLLAGLVAALVAYPLMRLSDAAAVITSFALLVVMHTIMVHWSAFTNGPRTLFGIQAATSLPIAAFSAAAMVAVALLFKESRLGLLLRTVRDDEIAAAGIGAHISRLRWYGFILSALMAGFGGGLWAHFITSFSPNAFFLKETFVILGMLIIGGSLTVSGAVFGTFAVTIVFELLRFSENAVNIAHVFPKPLVGLTEVVLACLMILTLIIKPGGIMGAREIGAWSVFRRFFAAEKSTHHH